MKYEIVHDDDPLNPRTEYENAGTILYTSSNYQLGDRRVTADEINAIANDDSMLVLPVYAHIHSGILLSTSPFGDPWDSGQCGIIYMTKEAAKEWPDEEAALATLKSEVETFSIYLAGDVLGWVITNDHGNVVDSCCGYYRREDAEQDARQSLACYQAEQAKKNEHALEFGA